MGDKGGSKMCIRNLPSGYSQPTSINVCQLPGPRLHGMRAEFLGHQAGIHMSSQEHESAHSSEHCWLRMQSKEAPWVLSCLCFKFAGRSAYFFQAKKDSGVWQAKSIETNGPLGSGPN